jgi:hypothetical protein
MTMWGAKPEQSSAGGGGLLRFDRFRLLQVSLFS